MFSAFSPRKFERPVLEASGGAKRVLCTPAARFMIVYYQDVRWANLGSFGT
jgi:hypothetical protein